MSRWIKNFIITASLLLVSCTSPVLPAHSNSATSAEVIHTTNNIVEVTDYLGEALQVLDASNLHSWNTAPGPLPSRYAR